MEDTAMQQLLTKLKEYSHSGWLSLDEIEQEILDFGVPIEKQQIQDAWIAGREFGCKHDDPKTAEEYYEKTYKK